VRASAPLLCAVALILALPIPGLGADALAMPAVMGMNDAAALGKVMLDQLELGAGERATQGAWDAEAWYGTDYDKLWLKSEGDWVSGFPAQGRHEVLWDRAILRWWDAQLGMRYDLGQGPTRGWVALGLQGLAPYGYPLEATLYVGDAGRTAARFRAEHDFLFTQRLILQPQLQTDLYGRSDVSRELGAGLSDLQLSVRLRYEIRREVAPYFGAAWRREFGASARLLSARGRTADSLQWIAGARIWF